jgi:hypothetical protein
MEWIHYVSYFFGGGNEIVTPVVVQIAQASEKVVLLCSLNELKEPPSKSRTQKYL